MTTITEPEIAAPFGRTPHGSPRISAYYDIIGDSPICGPDERHIALAYLLKIETALVQGGWKPYELNRLKKLRTRWARRASGKDARFNLVGTRDGRLPAEVEYKLGKRHRRDRMPFFVEQGERAYTGGGGGGRRRFTEAQMEEQMKLEDERQG